MSNWNKCQLMGNLTVDTQVSYTQNQTAVCEFGLATNHKYTDGGGNKVSEPAFFDVVAFGKQAETINKYVGKGDLFFLEGRMRYESWESDGKKRSKLRVVVTEFRLMPNQRDKR